jgi:butyryl-CoA dehydrogenase
MPFFTRDQEEALSLLHHADPRHADLAAFLSGPLADFAGKMLAPRAAANDADERFALDSFRELGRLGFMSLPFPEQYDGMGACFSYLVAGIETLAKADAGFTLGVAIHGTATDGIARFGSEKLRQRYVPKLIKGEMVGCFGLSETGSGSDARGSLKCAYARDAKSGEYVLNGGKYWITNAMCADLFFVMARDASGKVSAFVVEKGWRGTFEQHKIEGKMGVRGSNTAELVFSDYRVPAENLVGEEGKGFSYAMHMLNGGRVTIGGWATGIAQGAYEKFMRYAHERELFGKRLVDLDNTRRELSEMQIAIHGGRHLSYAAAYWKSQGADIQASAAIAKVAATDAAVHVAERAIQLSGGYGYVQESRIERHLRDALLGRIGEGANEVLKIVVIPRVLEAEFGKGSAGDLW